jgi:hypothetical protein
VGIPLADHFISQDEAAQNGEFLRPTYQATVDFIVNDLNNAIELLPNVYQGDDLEFGNTQIGRATKAAAAVLKSRALLYSASPAMQDDDVTKITGMGQFEILNPTVYQAKWEAVAKEINKILGMEGFGTYVPVTASSIAMCRPKVPIMLSADILIITCWKAFISRRSTTEVPVPLLLIIW